MNVSFQLIVPVLLPIFFGLLIGLANTLREQRIQQIFFAALALNAAAVFVIILQPDMRLELFQLTEHMPILLKMDNLTRLFCVLSSLMFLLAGIYTPEYMRHEDKKERFYMFYLIVLGMLMGFGFSGNLVTLYLFFEAAALLSVPLVLHSMKKEAIVAAFKFIYYSIAGASLGLIGLFFIYIYGTTLEFTPGGVLDMQKLAGHEERMLVVILLTIIGFGAKAGLFPLHAWLPEAHPIAPAPASAILSGVITKMGVFAIIRFVYYLVGPEFIRGTWVQTAWISIALFTVIMGSLLAFHESALKRRLAYSSVSQVSYVMFGLGILTSGALIASLLHMVFHSIIKNALFLAAGIIILRTNNTNVADMRGIGKQMPITILCFALLAVSIVGIPPTSGFISKWHLASASLAADIGFFSWGGVIILLMSALLTAGYLVPIAINGFFPGTEHDINNNNSANLEPGFSMLYPVLLLTAAAVIFGLFPGILLYFFESIAGEIM